MITNKSFGFEPILIDAEGILHEPYGGSFSWEEYFQNREEWKRERHIMELNRLRNRSCE